MIELILAIVMALISYFATKEKTGASNTQAAMAAAAAGLGTYYVASETEWGQGVVDSLSGWTGLPNTRTDQTTTVVGPNGESTKVPTATGSTAKPNTGTNAWDVLESWGPTATAATVGATGLAISGGLDKWLPWIAGAVAIFLLVK